MTLPAINKPVRILAMYRIFEPSDAHLDRLRVMGGEVTVAKSEADALTTAGNTDVILGHRYLRQILPHAPRLRWVQSTAGGVDSLPCAALHAAGIMLTRTTHTAPIIARHAHTLAWTLQRQLPEAWTRQRAAQWNPEFVWLPAPRRAGIFGTGNIGRAIAALLQRDGIQTIGIKRSTTEASLPEFNELHAFASARELLPTLDWCFLALPRTPETTGWFTDETLRLLPRHALLINVGRGPTVDSSALTRVLKSGHLGGAALDVVDTESHPAPGLWEAPRLLLTPHVAAHSAERRANSERFSEEQFARFLKGEPVQEIVDFVKEGLVS